MFGQRKWDVHQRVSSNQWACITFGKLLWKANKKRFSFRRVESWKISSHPGRYLLERMLKLSDAGVKNGWIEREEKLCVVRQHKGGTSRRVMNKNRILRGVVYKINSRGPRTKPRGTPHIQVWQEEKLLLHLTWKERDDKYDLNQSKAELWIPNQDNRRVSSMLWSMVSKAAERSRRQRQDTFYESVTLIRWSWM